MIAAQVGDDTDVCALDYLLGTESETETEAESTPFAKYAEKTKTIQDVFHSPGSDEDKPDHCQQASEGDAATMTAAQVGDDANFCALDYECKTESESETEAELIPFSKYAEKTKTIQDVFHSPGSDDAEEEAVIDYIDLTSEEEDENRSQLIPFGRYRDGQNEGVIDLTGAGDEEEEDEDEDVKENGIANFIGVTCDRNEQSISFDFSDHMLQKAKTCRMICTWQIFQLGSDAFAIKLMLGEAGSAIVLYVEKGEDFEKKIDALFESAIFLQNKLCT